MNILSVPDFLNRETVKPCQAPTALEIVAALLSIDKIDSKKVSEIRSIVFL